MADNEVNMESLINDDESRIETAKILNGNQDSPLLPQKPLAIRGINITKSYSRREFYVSKSKNPKILDNLNINVAKGEM